MWELYAADGTRIQHGQARQRMTLELPKAAGTYLFKLHGEHRDWTTRIVRQ